jgi:hypothetical protein
MDNAVSLACLTAVRIFIDIGRIPLRMGREPSIFAAKCWLRPSARPATSDQWVAARNPNSLCVIKCAARRIQPE